MTCRHVLALIDASPFADASQARLDRAWSHAATCATCGPALAASRGVTASLRGLALPAPPTAIAAAVRARLAAVELRDSETDVAPSVPVRTRTPDWLDLASYAGMALGVASVVAYGPSSDVIRVWNDIDVNALRTTPGTAVLLCGLVLYVTGLFASPRRRRM